LRAKGNLRKENRMNITNKTVLITGANRGIGRALVNEALRRGAKRVYAGTRGALTIADKRVTPLTLDVTSVEQIQRAVDKVDALGVLGVSVNLWIVIARCESELKATSVLEFLIEEASAKVRSGPPLDNEKDYGSPVWAGVLPLEVRSGTPIPDDNLVEGVDVPDHVLRYDARLDG
jgi:hypothetical protein